MAEPTTRKQRRAAEREKRKSERASGSSGSGGSSQRMWLAAIGVLAVVGVVAFVFLFAGGGEEEAPDIRTAVSAIPDEVQRDGRSLGDPDAPVKIEVFEDPQCPACGAFTASIEPLLVAGPVKDGQVYLTYRDLAFLGPESIDAAAGMRVAEALDRKFWEYHDVVFANQDGENRGAFSRERLAQMAQHIGLDPDEFLTELDHPRYAAAVAEETDLARQIGANSTPTLVINGELRPGVPSWEQLTAAIDAAEAAV